MVSEDESLNSINQSLYIGLATSESLTKDEDDTLEKKTERCLSDADKYQTTTVPESQKQKFIHRVEKLINKYKSAHIIRRIDKLMFLIGISRLVFEGFLLGKAPCYYAYYYSVVLCFLVFCRYIYYRWLHWHYFLLDFCYFANLMNLVFLWIYPESEFLFISAYGFSMGPLLLAVPIFKNSMVIHSLDKITSIFIHLVPGFMVWGIRSSECECWKVAKITPSLIDYILYPTMLYLVWAVPYYFILFKLTFKRCEKKNNLTLFKYVLQDKNSFFYKISEICGEKIRHLSFMMTHMVFSLLTLLITYVTLYNHYLQLFVLCLCLMHSFWMAANYYMEIFTKNYELRLEKLENLRNSLNIKKNN